MKNFKIYLKYFFIYIFTHPAGWEWLSMKRQEEIDEENNKRRLR